MDKIQKDRGPIGHHTVPQTNLRHFSNDGVNIYRFDKHLSKSEFLPISAISKRNHYYSFTESNGEKNSCIETEFIAPIDARYNQLVESLENSAPLDIIKDEIVEQISSQFGRVETQRGNIDRVMRDLQIDDSDFKQSLSGMFSLMDVHSSVTANSEFWIGIAKGHTQFLTSDNPAGRGFFPVTPKICIISSNKKDGVEYVCLNDDAVEMFNEITFNNAIRYIYSVKEFETRVPS